MDDIALARVFESDEIDNVPLFFLIKVLNDDWIAALFSTILSPMDTVKLWDFILVYKMPMVYQ